VKEDTLVAAIVNKLPKTIHTQSMTFGSLSANGTPDRYFDGPNGDLWIEFKQIAAWPRFGMVGGVNAKKRGCYSPLQADWMERRWAHGSNVLGVVGLPDKSVVIQRSPAEWIGMSPISEKVPRTVLVELIQTICLGETSEPIRTYQPAARNRRAAD
jgi:hypothetical protein